MVSGARLTLCRVLRMSSGRGEVGREERRRWLRTKDSGGWLADGVSEDSAAPDEFCLCEETFMI